MSYAIRLGPLSFVDPVEAVGEAIGDGLDVVGAALTAGERRPRPFKLKLPIRGDDGEAEPRTAGLRLRRQVRELIENPLYRLQGFFFTWSPDEDLDCWLLIGGAEIIETDPGISFGEWALELSDVYLRGRPGTHRPARRAAVSDLRSGLVPRDTRRLLYSTDFSGVSLPARPLYLPGDVADLVSTGNRPAESTAGLARGSRHLWRRVGAIDGEVLSYRPDDSLLPGRTKYLDLDDLGSVRVWDLSAATTYPPNPTGYTTEGDEQPTAYGWERILGDVLRPTIPLAVENGACRLVWLGPSGSQGLAIEVWSSTTSKFTRLGRVLHAANVAEQRVVECTPERAVLEWRAGRYGMRAILQRGWYGPRLESYDDGGEGARIEYAPEGAGAFLQPSGHVSDLTPRNYMTNPSFEHSAAGWVDHIELNEPGATLTRISTDAAPGGGTHCLEVKTTAGEKGAEIKIPGPFLNLGLEAFTYTFSVWLKGVTAKKVILEGPGLGSSVELTITTTWARYSLPCKISLGGAEDSFAVKCEEGAIFRLDEAMVELGPMSSYFDGDSTGAEWTGTPDASASIVPPGLLWMDGTEGIKPRGKGTVLTGATISYERTRVLIAQLAGQGSGSPTPGELASLSVIDARPVPVLIGRE
jgi:hypothetical protein